MDFQYTFRQAHQDRLEDAGFVQYRPSDGFRVLKAKRNKQLLPGRRRHPVLVSFINSLVK